MNASFVTEVVILLSWALTTWYVYFTFKESGHAKRKTCICAVTAHMQVFRHVTASSVLYFFLFVHVVLVLYQGALAGASI